MTRPSRAVLLLCAALAACGPSIPPDKARMPFVGGQPEIVERDAIALVEYNLADPQTLRGDPERAARAAASADWLAGQDWLSGDYGDYKPAYRPLWWEMRRNLRAILGVAPGTPSQLVVDRLLAAARALRSQDRAAAQAALEPPPFTLGGERTLAILADMPRVPALDAAAAELDRHLHPNYECRLPQLC